MRLQDAFLRVADRSLVAASVVANGVHEKAGFLAYHAFESAGGAYCTSRAVRFHPMSHRKKVMVFIDACRREHFARSAAQLAIELTSLRNACLYPYDLGGGVARLPESIISAKQAARLVGRVGAVVRNVAGVV